MAEIPEPLRLALCRFLSRRLETALERIRKERVIRDVETFTSLVYYITRVREEYTCEG